MTARAKGGITVGLGLLVIGAQIVILLAGIVPAGQVSRPVVFGFLAGLALVVKGGVEIAVNEPFSVAVREHKTVLTALLAGGLMLVALGIVYFTTTDM